MLMHLQQRLADLGDVADGGRPTQRAEHVQAILQRAAFDVFHDEKGLVGGLFPAVNLDEVAARGAAGGEGGQLLGFRLRRFESAGLEAALQQALDGDGTAQPDVTGQPHLHEAAAAQAGWNW